MISFQGNSHPVEHSFQGVLTVAAKSLQSDRVVHGLGQQPEGVQVVEWVGLSLKQSGPKPDPQTAFGGAALLG